MNGEKVSAWLKECPNRKTVVNGGKKIYLPSSTVTLKAFPVKDLSLLDDVSVLKPLSVKKPGSLGWGSTTSSFANMKTTEDISGLFSGNFWAHSKPTWMHLRTWDSMKDCSKYLSISSRALPSFHSSQAWKHLKTLGFHKNDCVWSNVMCTQLHI